MTSQRDEAIIYFVVSLSEITTTHSNDIIDLLTDVCWTEEKAGDLKEAIDKIQ